ncbi:MAG: hypothetical protein M3Q44_07070 [bacterium]|nr:hypothetical protein [bacterium]
MKNKTDTEILPEDRVQLDQNQINLVQMAFLKQIPPEDSKFLENVKSDAKESNDSPNKLFDRISAYFAKKYGVEFGVIFIAAIMGGEEKYLEAIDSVEKLRAFERVEKQNI